MEANGTKRGLQTSGTHSPGWLRHSGTELLLGGKRDILGARQLPSDTAVMAEPLQMPEQMFHGFPA